MALDSHAEFLKLYRKNKREINKTANKARKRVF